MKILLARLTYNMSYKATALLLGSMLWYFVQGEEIVEVHKKIAVNIVVDPGLVVKGSKVRYLEATIKGPRVLQSYYISQSVEAQLMIPKGKMGAQEFRIEKHMIEGWNPKLDIVIHDPIVSIFIDQKISRSITLKAMTQGLPGSGMTVEKIELKPNSVMVTGPKSEIDKTPEISTLPLDVSGLKASQSMESGLILDSAKGLTASPERVTAQIQLGESRVNRQFISIPLSLEGASKSTAYSPKFVSIVLQGTKKSIEAVERKEIQAFVDASELPPGSHHRRIQVKIPVDTTLIETMPSEALIEIHQNTRR